MHHLILLGDSIFDNAAYVPGGPAVINQLVSLLNNTSKATLLAVDGHVVVDVAEQIAEIPADASHLFVSVGGNDALLVSHMVDGESSTTAADVVGQLAEVQREFAIRYDQMLQNLAAYSLPITVCTIYDAVPGLSIQAVAGLSLFNDVIVRCASQRSLPVIDLRGICDKPEHYSGLSPIEPSVAGGDRIAAAIHRVLQEHDFSSRRTVIYE